MLLGYDDALSAWMIIAGIFGLLLFLPFLGAWAAQKLADWATTSQAPVQGGGFPIFLSPLPIDPQSAPATPPPLPATPRRFTILHHTGVPTPHFDLMFELTPGGALVTWRCPDWPIESPTLVERLADHRRDYLDYEGPVSNNRGRVTRVLGGTFRLETTNGNEVVVATDDHCRFTFRREGDTSLWWLELGSDGQGEAPSPARPL